jgi:hypothetical protein
MIPMDIFEINYPVQIYNCEHGYWLNQGVICLVSLSVLPVPLLMGIHYGEKHSFVKNVNPMWGTSNYDPQQISVGWL